MMNNNEPRAMLSMTRMVEKYGLKIKGKTYS
jgi:hypothetical protein